MADRWNNLLLRLQKAAYTSCRGQGLAIVTFRVAFRNGEPVQWAKPGVQLWEPGGANDLLDVLCAGGDSLDEPPKD